MEFRKDLLKISFGFCCLLLSISVMAEVNLTNLRCEMLPDPIGIDVTTPGLSWEITSRERGIKQTIYRIIVASSSEKLTANEGDLWDSGMIKSGQSIHVIYGGDPLKSRMDCYWKVKIWTENEESDWSKPGKWTMGFLYYNDWSGRWIGFDRLFPWDNDQFHSRLSARYFRKEFHIGKPVRQAKAYIIGLGLYELSVNGKKIGDQVLSPTPTDYTKNIKYNVFNVTREVRSGNNAIGVILGNGRYYTMRQHSKPYKIKNFGYPKLLLQLEINYEDGTKSIVTTDNTWKGTAAGPILTNNEYDGEEYDARREMPGWNMTGFDDRDWLEAEYVEEPRGESEAQLNPNMKVIKSIQPVSVTPVSPGKYILDMGQNMVGWLKMSVKGNAGDQVKLRFAEVLDESGELFTANLRDARATDIYTLKGGEKETWEPQFIYHGFRYVEITGYPGKPVLDNFSGQVVSDGMQQTGQFETSNGLINQLFKNAWWGILGNYKGMPLDCPQRNERQPWLGDRAAGCYGESFLFDNSLLYAKWTDDIAYSQKADGAIGDVAPAFWRYYSDNMTWPGTFLMVADMLYRQYGDANPIKKHYQSMKKWLAYMRDRYMTDDFIITKDSYGDWCPPPVTIEAGRGKSADRKEPSKLISTAYYYYFLELMQRFATLSGHEEDIISYKNLAKNIKTGFNQTFFREGSGAYGDNKLTENLLALKLGLVPEDKKEQVFASIVKNIRENGGHLSTGLIGTQWIMRTLTQHGRADIAYQLASNKTYPGWGYMVENGATTIWELWNGNTAAPNMNSYNHVMMLGDLLIWFYENLAGIKSSEEYPGFKQIIMKPEPVDGLDFVNASYQSVHGLIKSEWKKKGHSFNWYIVVPANTTALVYLPAQSKDKIRINDSPKDDPVNVRFLKLEEERALFEVGSGEYHFQSE